MDEIISYKMCAVKVRIAKLRNYLKLHTYSQGSRLEFFTSIHYGYQHFKLGIQIQKSVSKYKLVES